jgi:outer membrane protein TolC
MNARFLIALWATGILAQTPPPPAPAVGVITLPEALARARQYAGQAQAAGIAVGQAAEDRAQARAARLPSASAFNQFIYTQGNATPSGVFVANDGVHVYNEQLVVHQEFLSIIRSGEVRRALALEAVARAKGDIAARGLNATVIQDYFAIPAAERKLVYTNTSLAEARDFLDITQKQEQGGEAAHADVVKAQVLVRQRERDVSEAQLAVDKAKIALGVLIFPDLSTSYEVVDDLDQAAVVPPLEEARAKASATSPDLKAAQFNIESSGHDVNVARYGYLPSLGLDFFYGIDANTFSAHTLIHEPDGPFHRNNLGYVAQATLNVPIWNWGTTRSKVKQAELRRDQAQLDLTLAQRTLAGNVAGQSREAQTAQTQIASLRDSEQLSIENLRLTTLRYRAGEATAFEVVDAQATLTAARNAYIDGLSRFKIAFATLQNLTGSF